MEVKKRMSNKKNFALFVPLMSVLAVLMVVLIVLSLIFADTISLYLYGIGGGELDEKTLSEGTTLVENIVEEGTVLLKNENGALPLTESEAVKVNVFGWAAYDWMTSTFGSGFSNTSLEKVKLFPALEYAGVAYNTTLYNMYKNFYSGTVTGWGSSDWNEFRGDVGVGSTQKFVLHEPGAAFYTDDVIAEATAFSDVALVVIGRTGGEAADLRSYQTKQVQNNGSNSTVTDNSRGYLQLSTEEEEMIAAAKRACKKVVVLLNTSNAMELGFLEDEGIDAALLVGLTGLTGVKSVVDILRGCDKDGNPVSPSGRTADTYAYSIDSAPSSVNSGYGGAKKYAGLPTSSSYNKNYFDAYLDYHEGIYVGYRYYETAAEAGYIDYDATVQYPFGYGLSYTDFEWTVSKVLINGNEKYGDVTLGADDKIAVYVDVKNTGSMAGKEVVQLYYAAPYYKGKIEKSSVVLGAFDKTGVIEPGATKTVKLELNVRDMASYDCYDANGNGFAGYELDGGTYTLRLMNNSHELAVPGEGSKTGAELVYTVPQGGYTYGTDGKTGAKVENRFTGSDTIDGYALDGSEETTPVVYLSRADLAGTFPKSAAARTRSEKAYNIAKAVAPTDAQLAATGYAGVEDPIVGSNADLTLADMLAAEGYDDEDWELLVWQMSTSELFNLIRDSYFKTQAIASIEKPIYTDLDGPLGLNTRVMSNTACNFISYPGETLVAQTFNLDLAYSLGLSVGNEARSSGSSIRGWYGPAANIHRNPYCGRNGEYYSEDALLSGKFAAETVRGAKNAGLYCYMKHFVANDSESLREGLYTFMTEQTLREIYLRPFELAVKEGGANAMMTSMNRLGAAWAGASYALCTEVLRDEWGFRGSVVTDWVDTGNPYMPVYKGIWAGNDLWLNNSEATPMFKDSDYANNKTFVTLSQQVAHNVLWTFVDTEQTRLAYDPDSEISSIGDGQTLDRTWVWYVVLVEAALAAGIGVSAFFLVRNLRRNKRAATADAQ